MDEDMYSSYSGRKYLSPGDNSPHKHSLYSNNKEQERELRLKISQAEIEELKQSLRYVEIQLARSKEQNGTLAGKLEESKNEIKKLADQLQQQTQVNHIQSQHMQELKIKLEDANALHQEMANRTQSKFYNTQSDMQKKEEEIEYLKNILQDREEDIRGMRAHEDKLISRIEELEDELEARASEVNILNTRLIESEKAKDDMMFSRKSDLKAKLLIDKLQEENHRLKRLLRSTQEFKDHEEFIVFTQGLNYLPKKSQKARLSKTVAAASTEPNAVNWIPAEALQIAEEFKRETGIDINKLISKLNMIWRDREFRQLNKIKHESNTELMALRRMLAMRIPYDEHRYIEEKKKLKAELTQTFREIVEEDDKEEQVVFEKPKEEKPKEDPRLKEAIKEMSDKFVREANGVRERIYDIANDFKAKKAAFSARPTQEKILESVTKIVDDFKNNVSSIVPTNI